MAIHTVLESHHSSDEGSDDGHHHPSTQQPQQQHTTQLPLHQHTISSASTATVDIEAWTVSALQSLNIAPIARGTGNTLSIPLDDGHHAEATAETGTPRMKLRKVVFDDQDTYGVGITPPRRPPSRRDSIKRREELLKGKEGSRQRRRWENDHLLHVPGAQPPTPSDFLVHPTYPVHATVPYQLAQYWDKGLRDRVEERKAAFAVHRKKNIIAAAFGGAAAVIDPESTTSGARAEVGKVPKDLRATAKKTPAVKSWLRVLEEPVRGFLVEQQRAQKESVAGNGASDHSDLDSEDEEIVFVGRNVAAASNGMPSARDGQKAFKKAHREMPGADGEKAAQPGLVLDTLGDEESAGAFKRWLTHSISDYYGLDSKSVMVGTPARKVVYIAIKQQTSRKRRATPTTFVLPRPLFEMF